VGADLWYHIAVTYTYGDGNTAKIYLNGVEQFGYWNLGTGNATVFQNNSEPIKIGARKDSSLTSFFDGMIDEVKIFNYALTEEQVWTEYNGGAVRFGE
jgi:hypothetical protein